MLLVERHEVTDRATWLDLRTKDVTASDIGSVCGVNPHRSMLRVFAEKTGAVSPEVENRLMRRGLIFEGGAIEELRHVRPTWEIRKANVYLRAPEVRIGATPDVVAVDPSRSGFGNVQIKITSRSKFRSDWLGLDEVKEGDDEDERLAKRRAPLYYQLQTLTEAKLLGASWAALAVLWVSEFDYGMEIFEVDLRDEAWEKIQDEVASFWRYVDAGIQPPVDPEKDAATIAALYPKITKPEKVDLTGDNYLPALLEEREQIMSTIKSLEGRKEEIGVIIKDRVRDHAGATLPGWVISWSEIAGSTYTVTRKPSRSMRVTRKKAA